MVQRHAVAQQRRLASDGSSTRLFDTAEPVARELAPARLRSSRNRGMAQQLEKRGRLHPPAGVSSLATRAARPARAMQHPKAGNHQCDPPALREAGWQ